MQGAARLRSKRSGETARPQPTGRPLQNLKAGRPSPAPTRPPPSNFSAQRVISVDALRGFSMFWILGADVLAIMTGQMLSGQGPVLRTIGAVLGAQFEHAPWEGFRFYDLIFPLFIFVTGVSIVFSMTRLLEKDGRTAAHLRIVRRALLLFALGVICNGGMTEVWSDMRWAGVLQRIAVCYLVTALLFLNLRLSALIIVFATALAGYWALMTFVPVPGIGAGSFAKTHNLAQWIDQNYLPGRKTFGSFDSEGILSTIPAIGTCLLGTFAGTLIRSSRFRPEQKSLYLIGSGALMIGTGMLWSIQFPIIKGLWTSSFVLVAGGWSAILLGSFHQLIDVRGRQAWASIFIWIGTSAIVLYVINNIASFERMAVLMVGGGVSRFFDQYIMNGAGRFIAHALGLAIAIGLARFLYRRQIFLRL